MGIKSNPYTILDLDRSASKREIVQAKATAMKKKSFLLREIAQAEKILLDPQKRVLADFLLPIPPTPKRCKPILSEQEHEFGSQDLEEQDVQLFPQSLLSELNSHYCSSEYIGSLVIEKIRKSKIDTDIYESDVVAGCCGCLAILVLLLMLGIFGIFSLQGRDESPDKHDNNYGKTLTPSVPLQRSQTSGSDTGATIDSEIDAYQYPSDSPELTLQDTCGSPKRSSSQRWWAIWGPKAAFSLVKTRFCADAFIVGNEVQVASFDNEDNAYAFLHRLNNANTPYIFTIGRPQFSPDTPPQLTLRPFCGSTGSVKGKTWWPVKGPRTALDTIKTKFCADALLVRGTVQVASFNNKEEALEFADMLNRQLPYTFWVDEPTER